MAQAVFLILGNGTTHVPYGKEVAERLGHLLLVHRHEPVVHPVAHVRVRARGAALRQLVLVVREHEVLPPPVDVEGRAQVLGRHGAALDVPPGAAAAPGAVPGRLALLGGLSGDMTRVKEGIPDMRDESRRMCKKMRFFKDQPILTKIVTRVRELAILQKKRFYLKR
jgi:hypothetical protein